MVSQTPSHRHKSYIANMAQHSSGGLSIVGGGGKIDINNTFDERLKLLEDNALPAVRSTLFGANVNRKFFD